MFRVTLVMYLLYLDRVFAEVSVQRFCGDLETQERIDISQLTGMWFAVEIVSHKQEATTMPSYPESCAVITISDKPYVELSPIYKNYQYNQSYGPSYINYDTHETRTEPTEYHRNQYYTANRNRYRDPKYRQQIYQKQRERKPLSISWDEDGATVAYAAYYTHPVGIWYIYGPNIDSSTPPGSPNHLVGMVQVLKAVGNHLVLTFCHRWPEEKLYTLILSRAPKLNREDLSGVHNLLRRKELAFVNTRKMCLLNSSTRFSISYVFIFLLYITLHVS